MLKKILIGNKCDMVNDRVISTETGRELAEEYGIKFLEASAKTDTNVSEIFTCITADVLAKIDPNVTPVKPLPPINSRPLCCKLM